MTEVGGAAQETVLRLSGASSSSDDLTPRPQPAPAIPPAAPSVAVREAVEVAAAGNRTAVYGIAVLVLVAALWFLLR